VSRSRRWDPGRAGGFTLLELLIAMTILGVVVVLLFGGLRIGVRAWEKGEAGIEDNQRQRVVLDLMRRQIVSARVVPPSRTTDEETQAREARYRVAGDEKTLRLASYVPVIPGNTYGQVVARYSVSADEEGDTERLRLEEKNLVLLALEEDWEEALSAAEPVELLSGVTEMGFEYLKVAVDEDGTVNSAWQSAWDPESDEGYPRAVRITLQTDSKTSPYVVVARIEGQGVTGFQGETPP